MYRFIYTSQTVTLDSTGISRMICVLGMNVVQDKKLIWNLHGHSEVGVGEILSA